MRIPSGLVLAGVAVGAWGCVSATSESRGSTRAKYAGPVPVMFTNASPARLCGLFMSDDQDDDYGDNWLPAEGLPSGRSVDLRMKPGKYKARWNSCKGGPTEPWYAATLWRETAVVITQQTQLYAFVADTVAPTKHAATMGRDYRVVRFVGQPIDRNPQPGPPRAQPDEDAPVAAEELPPIAGFVGLVVLDAEQVAVRQPVERFDAHDFVDPRARLAKGPAAAGAAAAGAKGAGPAAGGAATAGAKGAGPAAANAPATPAAPPKPAVPQPSLSRKHDLADSAIEYRKR